MYCPHIILKFIAVLLLQVEEFGRDIYKLVKIFTQKAKQANKSRDIGGGVTQSIHVIIQFVTKTTCRLEEVRVRVRRI